MTGFLIGAVLLSVATLLLLGWPWWAARRAAAPEPGAAADAAAALVTTYRGQLAELRADLDAGTLDMTRYEQSRRELEQRLLQEVDAAAPVASAAIPPAVGFAKRGWLPILLFVLVLPVALYWRFGTPAALDPALVARGPTVTPQQIDAMIAQLKQHLKDTPGDGQGWTMLGRSMNILGRYAEAVDAYRHAAALVPDDAQFYADYADAVAMANGQSLEGEPMKLVERALKIDPDQPKALALAGTFEFENQNFPLAIKLWQRAQKGAAKDPEFVAALENSIGEARQRSGTAAPLSTPAAAASTARIQGRVTLAPALAAKAAPDDTVFVYARAAEGPKMPLALIRRQVKDLPFDFTLDDASAMVPSMTLSRFDRVVVAARVSKSGAAAPQAGDLQTESAPISSTTTGLALEIAKVVP